MKIIGEEEFKNEVLTSKDLVLVDFFATWCGPCKMLAPVLEKVAEENTDVKIYKIDVDQDSNLAMDYDVEVVPTVVFMKDGKELDRVTGFVDKTTIVEKIENYK